MSNTTVPTQNQNEQSGADLLARLDELAEMLEKTRRDIEQSGQTQQEQTPTDAEKIQAASLQIQNTEASNVLEQIGQLIQQLEISWQQRAELGKLESELSQRIEKFHGQRKSLYRKVRHEWKQIKAKKQELKCLRDSLIATTDSADTTSPEPNEDGMSAAELDEARVGELYELK